MYSKIGGLWRTIRNGTSCWANAGVSIAAAPTRNKALRTAANIAHRSLGEVEPRRPLSGRSAAARPAHECNTQATPDAQQMNAPVARPLARQHSTPHRHSSGILPIYGAHRKWVARICEQSSGLGIPALSVSPPLGRAGNAHEMCIEWVPFRLGLRH